MTSITKERTQLKPNLMLKQIIQKVLLAENKKVKKEQRDELIKYLKKNY